MFKTFFKKLFGIIVLTLFKKIALHMLYTDFLLVSNKNHGFLISIYTFPQAGIMLAIA